MENQQSYHQAPKEPEITLADIILTVQAYILHLVRKWYWIMAAVVVGMAIAYLVVRMQDVNHIAEITFVANEESQRGGNSILASTLASFGLSAESDGETSRYSKIIALSQSRKIQFAALLDSVKLDGKRDLIVNHISRLYDLQNKWGVDEPVHFINQSPDSMDIKKKQYIKRIYSMLVNESRPLYSISFDNTSQMIKMKTETVDPDLSIALVQSLYENLNKFYVTQSTAKGNETVNTLIYRKDSLENVLQKQQASLARATDRSRGMTYQSDQTGKLDMGVDLTITRTMYTEVAKNLELARFNLENIRPVFTIIDYPFKPLPTDRINLYRYLAIFGIVGAVLAIMMLILRKMYADIMRGVRT